MLPPARPTDSFLPCVCHRQKNVTSPSFSHEKKSPRRSALQNETSTLSQKTVSVSFDWQGGHRGNPLKTHTHHHHDVYRHVSLGAAAPAFCLNYAAVRLYSGVLLCVNEQRRRIGRETTAAVSMWCYLQLIGLDLGWIWTRSCVAILPSHSGRQVCGSECRNFGFDTCIVTALMLITTNCKIEPLYLFMLKHKYHGDLVK